MKIIGYGWAALGGYSIIHAFFQQPPLETPVVSTVILISMLVFIIPGMILAK